MSSSAALRLDRTSPQGNVSLGPAEVLTVAPDHVTVRLGSGEVARAQVALAFTYEPAVGDLALVAGDGAAHYVIGILNGSGKTTLDLPGDVDLRAQGKLRLRSEAGVEIQAPKISLEARSLELLAGAVVERFRSLRQRISELYSVQAGEQHTVVEGSSRTQAKSAAILSEEKVTINGREVHLG